MAHLNFLSLGRLALKLPQLTAETPSPYPLPQGEGELWLCFELVFFGRLSPRRTPSPQSSPIQGEGVALLYLVPWSSRGPSAAEELVRLRDFGFFGPPLLKPRG